MAKMIKVTLTKSVIGASPKQKKVVEAIKMGMSLDPNMTPEMIEEYTPAIEQIVMTNAKYGK